MANPIVEGKGTKINPEASASILVAIDKRINRLKLIARFSFNSAAIS
jgi:hypothetical protein